MTSERLFSSFIPPPKNKQISGYAPGGNTTTSVSSAVLQTNHAAVIQICHWATTSHLSDVAHADHFYRQRSIRSDILQLQNSPRSMTVLSCEKR